MRSILGWNRRQDRVRKPRSLDLFEGIQGLERRDLLTAGSITSGGAYVMVTPASTGPNTTVVSYQQQNGTMMLDVNLNGSSQYFNASQVTSLYYLGNSASGSQTFEDSTNLSIYAMGGSGTNVFEAGSGNDTFIGGTGSNTFDAGTGCDLMMGGSGTNTYNESATGFGLIEECGGSNTIQSPAGQPSAYVILP